MQPVFDDLVLSAAIRGFLLATRDLETVVFMPFTSPTTPDIAVWCPEKTEETPAKTAVITQWKFSYCWCRQYVQYDEYDGGAGEWRFASPVGR